MADEHAWLQALTPRGSEWTSENKMREGNHNDKINLWLKEQLKSSSWQWRCKGALKITHLVRYAISSRRETNKDHTDLKGVLCRPLSALIPHLPEPKKFTNLKSNRGILPPGNYPQNKTSPNRSHDSRDVFAQRLRSWGLQRPRRRVGAQRPAGGRRKWWWPADPLPSPGRNWPAITRGIMVPFVFGKSAPALFAFMQSCLWI